MDIHPIPRLAGAAALVLAPLFGLVAAVATPALKPTASGEIAAIARDPGAFHVYAATGLVSAYLLIPAFFALMALIRTRSARWSYLAGGLAQIGLLVAVGDSATELMYSQMGARSADHAQMVALSQRYDSVSAMFYGPGGMLVLVGTVLVGIALWRTRVVPRWTSMALVVGMLLNIGGFVAADKSVLVASYVVMLAAFGRIALVLVRPEVDVATAPEPVLTASA